MHVTDQDCDHETGKAKLSSKSRESGLRTVFRRDQRDVLARRFAQCRYLTATQAKELAEQVDLPHRAVQVHLVLYCVFFLV